MLLRDSATVFSAFTGSSVNAVATLRRKRRQSSIINAKKIYDEAQMVRRVRAYLQNLNVIEDEAQLVNLSQLCEPPPAGLITSLLTSSLRTFSGVYFLLKFSATFSKRRDPSPGPGQLERTTHLGPKFGESHIFTILNLSSCRQDKDNLTLFYIDRCAMYVLQNF